MLFLLLLVAVSYLALTPSPPEQLDTGWDKLNHVLAFSALGFCASLSYQASRGTRWPVLGALLGFGGLIELLQRMVPGRSSDVADLLADAIGIGCGAVVATGVAWAAARLSQRWR
jgi:VanZ family protein